MKLTTIAMFGLGYVLGSRAGRDRYDQLVEAARQAASRFEESRSSSTSGDEPTTVRADGNGADFDWTQPLPRT